MSQDLGRTQDEERALRAEASLVELRVSMGAHSPLYADEGIVHTVTARCVGCKKEREIGAGEVEADSVPMCEACFMPMFAVGATAATTAWSYETDTEPIHTWFELTYANYLCLPRSVLQSMPVEWQRSFTALLREMSALYAGLDWPSYRVSAVDQSTGRFIQDPIPHYNRGRTHVEPCP